MSAALRWMPAKAYGGPLRPTVVVIHCTESDNGAGTAESLAGPNWFGGPAGTSAHKMFDRDSGVEMVRRTVVAYAAGPRGNTVGIHYEFCGRASWSAAKWREPAQLNMLRLAAPHIADDLRANAAPARWLSLAQLASDQRGLCTHNDIRLALGGTTHSDPGPNFPYAELLGYVQAALTGAPIEEDDMPTPDELWNHKIDGVEAWKRLLGIDTYMPARVWEQPVHGIPAMHRLLGIDNAANAAASGVRAAADPAAIAAAVKAQLGDDLAREVVAELGKQLAP